MSKKCKAEDDLLFLKQELKNAEMELNLNVLFPNKNIIKKINGLKRLIKYTESYILLLKNKENLKSLINRKETIKNSILDTSSISEMPDEELENLEGQYGWFSDDISRFDDLEKCYYDMLDTVSKSSYCYPFENYESGEPWKYFLPVSELQKLI